MVSVKQQLDELQSRMQQLRGKSLVDQEECPSTALLEIVLEGSDAV